MNEVPKEAFWRQFWALLPVYINVLMTGCASGWLPNAIYFFGEEKGTLFNDKEIALIASCSDLGKMGFALPGGLLVDRVGRKTIIIIAGILNFSCWLSLSLHSSLVTICIVRILLGMSTSLVTTTSLIYIGEIASPEARGKLTSICHTFLTIGTLSQCVVTILFTSHHSLSYWNTGLSSLYFLSMVFLMETPNYLVSVSKPKEAKANLNHIRSGYTQKEVNVEFENLQQYIEEENYRKHQTNWVKFIRSRAIRKPLIIIIVLNFLSSAIGRSVISSYITHIYPTDISVPKQFYPLIGELIQLLVSVFTVFYIDRFSRRSIFMVGGGIMAITMLFCAFTNYEWVKYGDGIAKWLFLFGNIFSGMVSNGFIHPVRNAVQSEILPQTVKGFGGSLSIIFMSLGNVISLQVYTLVKDSLGLYFLYLIFCVNSAILGVFLYVFLPEGRGKYLAEINFHDEETISQKDPA